MSVGPLMQKRLERGLTRSELARRIGVSRTLIQRYEEHGSVPGLDIAFRYAEALGVTTAELMQLIEQNKAVARAAKAEHACAAEGMLDPEVNTGSHRCNGTREGGVNRWNRRKR